MRMVHTFVASTVRHLSVASLSLLIGATITLAAVSSAGAQQSFDTPDEAATALVGAVRTGAMNDVMKVLGRRGQDIVSSGDRVADADIRQRFLAAYDEQNKVVLEGRRKAVLTIGKDAFPFPIPIVGRNGRWVFDTAAGREEILYRRIGRNELSTIQASLAYVDAQREYAEKDRGAGAGAYALRIVSWRGKTDGLYWPTAEGNPESPLGDLVAQASNEGYQVGRRRSPYHGYYFKILTKQGPDASGGALDYVVGGRMIGGFALLAYPAEYKNSGVMSFIVNHDGVVYEKDLGTATMGKAWRYDTFNPDKTWRKADIAPPTQ